MAKEPYYTESIRKTLIDAPREGHPRYHAAKRAKMQPAWEAHKQSATRGLTLQVVVLALLALGTFACLLWLLFA